MLFFYKVVFDLKDVKIEWERLLPYQAELNNQEYLENMLTSF
jgi:hypothetical protein